MPIILGIDPGSRVTGYGVIRSNFSKHEYLDSGCIRGTAENLSDRLLQIYQGVQQIVKQYSPHEMAIEQVFLARNVDSALKLGQAKGAAIVAVASHGIRVWEYSARQIKLSVVGQGGAQKSQVQHMVRTLLALDDTPQSDAADALGVAICHAHTQGTLIRLSGVKKRQGA